MDSTTASGCLVLSGLEDVIKVGFSKVVFVFREVMYRIVNTVQKTIVIEKLRASIFLFLFMQLLYAILLSNAALS